MKLNLKIISLLFALIFSNAFDVMAQSSNEKCSYKEASIYFANPTPILEKYSKDFFCSDILYLERNGIGAISVAQYKNMYGNYKNNFNYLRSFGITPNIIQDYFVNFDEENETYLSTQELLNDFIKTSIVSEQIGADFTITPSKNFTTNTTDFDNSDEFIGSIINKNGRNCITDKRINYSSDNPLYTPASTLTYFDVISAIPLALRPVAIKGTNFVNIFDETVATIEYNTSVGGNVLSQGLGKSSVKRITFNNKVFSQNVSVNVNWNENKCKADNLKAEVAKSSVCFMCPYIVMIFNEISFLFDFMYKTFSKYIISFLVLFGCFYFATTFLSGFKNAPFSVDLSDYYSKIAEKLRLIFIVSVVLLTPVNVLFSFTFQPIIDLTLGVSSKVLSTQNIPSTCNPDTVIDEINQRKVVKTDDQIIPPVVKNKQIQSNKILTDSYVLSKDTMGNIVCFLTDTLQTNAKQMTMGKVLMKNLFNFSSDTKVLSFFIGLLIWGLFFIMNFMISFYILDGLLDILKIAILWPFMVFGYAFNWIGFNITSIINTAKNFGFTMITLAIFSLFNRTLIYGFYFKNANKDILSIIDNAIETNNPNIILDSIPTDIISVSQFIFIIYAMYYVYSRLSEFAQSYGGSAGQLSLGENLRKTFKSILGLKVSRENPEFVKQDAIKKKDDKIKQNTKENDETIVDVKEENKITDA